MKETLDRYAEEVRAVVRDYGERARNLNGGDLLALRREENRALAELLERQARAFAVMAGEKVEPQVHFGEAIVVATMGGGG